MRTIICGLPYSIFSVCYSDHAKMEIDDGCIEEIMKEELLIEG